MVTLRSPYVVENATSLDLGVHMAYADSQLRQRVNWHGALPGRPATSSLFAGEREPLQLPLAVVAAGLGQGAPLGLRVEGGQWALHSLSLRGAGLDDGSAPTMYECPPPDGGGHPIHVCLRVERSVIKVFNAEDGSGSGGGAAGQQEELRRGVRLRVYI